MGEMQSPQNGLNEVQLALLRMFNRPMSEAEVGQVRDLLLISELVCKKSNLLLVKE